MRYNKIYALFLLINFHRSLGSPGLLTYSATRIDDLTQEITITFSITEKDFITVSVHTPTVTLSAWQSNKLPIAHYDPLFKETKQVFLEDFAISVTATAQKAFTEPLYLYCSYYRRSEKKINQTLIPLFLTTHNHEKEQPNQTDSELAPYAKQKKISMPHHNSPIDDYFFTILCKAHHIIQSLRTDHKKYFSLLMMCICLLLSLSYFLKEQLRKQIRLQELLEVAISLLTMPIITYGLFYLHTISTPLLTMSAACCSAIVIGFFYTKKKQKNPI